MLEVTALSLPCRFVCLTQQTHFHLFSPLQTIDSPLRTHICRRCGSRSGCQQFENRTPSLPERCEHESRTLEPQPLVIVSFGSSLRGQSPIHADSLFYRVFLDLCIDNNTEILCHQSLQLQAQALLEEMPISKSCAHWPTRMARNAVKDALEYATRLQ